MDGEQANRNVLVLNYTLACPLACDFCCYGCHPGRPEKMPIELASRLIAEAAQMREFSSVAITGGEPLLFLDEIVCLGGQIASFNLPWTLATAAHWADSEKVAIEVVGALASCGLSRVGISCDPSHQEFVPKNNVIRAARAFRNHGVETFVVCTFSDGGSAESYLPELVSECGINLRTQTVAPAGRGAKSAVYPLMRGGMTCYRQIYHDIVVFFDGEVYPCCSVFNRSTKGLCIGNANTIPLRDLFVKINGSLLLKTMKQKGVDVALEQAIKYDERSVDQVALGRGHRDGCELCHKAFRKRDQAALIKTAFAEIEIELIDKILSTAKKISGEREIVSLANELCQQDNDRR